MESRRRSSMVCIRALRDLTWLIALSCTIVISTSAAPYHLRCEFLENPLGLDRTPRFSWQSDSSERDWTQVAYEIFVASSEENLRLGRADIWDSGKIDSGGSVGILYAGPRLESRRHYYWKVRVWSAKGIAEDSQESARWEMGFLSPTDWKANWIGWKNPETEGDRAAMRWLWIPGKDAITVPPKTVAIFQTRIQLAELPQGAALFVAARGDYVAEVNGREVAHKHHWFAIDRADITDNLVVGENVVRVKIVSPSSSSFGPEKGKDTFPAAFAGLVKINGRQGQLTRVGTTVPWEVTFAGSPNPQPAALVGDLSDSRFVDPGSPPEAAIQFRKEVELSAKVKNARLFVTALGSYRVFINGERVGEDVLTPEFTDYRKRVLYQTYDVTAALKPGKNTLGAELADGWYGSALTWLGNHFFSPPNRLIAQLEVEYEDKRRDTFVTGETWKASASPILHSEIYAGEVYDARLEKKGWNLTGFDDSGWTAATVEAKPLIAISSQITTPPRVVLTLTPKSLTKAPNGSLLFDLGQNMVGTVSLKLKGSAGTRVRLRFAEILQPDGSIYTENLRDADATDVYVMKGGGEEIFTPAFTFHGFQYVEVSGYRGELSTDALRGNVVSSVAATVGQITTSSDLVNKMWKIGIWGQRGNFLSIPTDCPQRDERLGWMGDAGVFWRTGAYNFDLASFSQKFAQDIVDAQTPEGAYTNVAPNLFPIEGLEYTVGAPGWADAGVIVPWTTWTQYGDTQVITRNWDSMQRWMHFVRVRNASFIRSHSLGLNFADWLAPDGHTDATLVATAYWALTANMMAQMADAIGRKEDASAYRELFGRIRDAFQRAYVRSDGTVGNGTQTSYVVALYAKLAPPELEPVLVNNLVKAIEARNSHLSTGFLGTPFLLFVLSDHGRSDVAYRLLLTETYPSWGYMLSKGATTWWERWNGDTGDPAMNSYNHYAFGSVMAWVYRRVVGIDNSVDEPGFKKIVIRPNLDTSMPSAKGEYDSVYGKITIEWTNKPNEPFLLKVKIPANTSADVYLPTKPNSKIFESGKEIQGPQRDGASLVHVGSGTYAFEVK